MNKRVLVILFTVVLLLSSTPVVYADVVMGNDFQDKNQSKTQKIERQRFIINSPDGFVIPQQEPGQAKEEFTWPRPWTDSDLDVILPRFNNGEFLDISQVYIHNGEYWGVMPSAHCYSWPGWVKMNHLLVVYEREDFEKENEDKFYTYSGDFNSIYAADKIVLWQWPGSDREKKIIDSKVKNIVTYRAYKDSEGREWGYAEIEYFGWTSYAGEEVYLKETSWICLTEPATVGITTFTPSALPAKWSLDGNYEWVHTVASVDTTDYSLSNFRRIRKYEPGITFDDVSESALHVDSIIKAYEYGIINNRYYTVRIDENSWRYVDGIGADEFLKGDRKSTRLNSSH